MALSTGYQIWPRTPVTHPEIYIDGLPMSGISAWGSLHTKTVLRGDDEATWSIINLPGRKLQRHPALVRGAAVDIKLGPTPIWVGTLTEPNWDSGDLTAVGCYSQTNGALCFNGSGQTSTVPNTVIDQAISRGGLGFTRRDDFGSTAIGSADDTAKSYTYLSELLDAWADENNSGWAINQRRQLIITGAPTVTDPRWYVAPGVGELGQADGDRTDRVFVRYYKTGGALGTASWPAATPPNGIERAVDATSRGQLASTDAACLTRATNIAKGIYTKTGAGHSGWTNGLELDRTQVSTPGGGPARLGFVRAGDTMRLLGVPDPRGTDHHVDVVIGDTETDWDARTVQANPIGLAARSFEDVIAQEPAYQGFVAL